MGNFKSRKKNKKNFRLIIILFIIVIILTNYYSKKYPLNNKYMNYLSYDFFSSKIENKKENSKVKEVFNEVIDKTPIVYIYNTHQTEKYKYEKLASYNIDYTVEIASYMFQSYLEKYNIYSIVENTSMSKTLKDNNLKYKDSYKGSRILLENASLNNPSIKYFIDLHRDSSVYEKTTCEIDGVKYAKLLFVVGLEHANYEKNLNMVTKLNDLLKEKNECLSRGIMKKEGEGVDGKYNQDFNENVILIEVGGQYNYIDEVDNILKILADILNTYIKEDNI